MQIQPTPVGRPYKVDISGNRESYKAEILFEDPETTEYLRHQRALSIVQTALRPDNVIFSIPKGHFDHQSSVFQLVLDQLGPVVGNYFNPLSLRGSRSRTDFVFSTRFRDPETTQLALTEGIIIDGVQYRAIPFKDKTTSNNHIRVNLRLEDGDEDDVMLANLKVSMANYGKVLQIKRLINHGFFEGEVSILLDRSSETDSYQDLQRMLYLESWDIFVPASYKGAKPVCFYCREEGHVRKECLALEKIVCFRCGDTGHTQRRCRSDSLENPPLSSSSSETVSFEEDLAAYESSQAKVSSSQLSLDKETPIATDLPTDLQVVIEALFSDSLDSQLLEVDHMMKDVVENGRSVKNSSQRTSSDVDSFSGTSLSKYAPNAMDVDPKVRLPTRSKKITTVDDDMKNVNPSPANITLARKGHE